MPLRSTRPTRSPRAAHSRRLGAALAVAALLLAASPASATYETLKRSLGNIFMAPIDMVLSPVVASHTIYNNLRDIDDSLGVRVVYVPMGVCWNTGVQAMSAVVREITGLIEFVPGLMVLFLDADLDPIYAPVERGNALLDVETPVIRLKTGVDYTTVPF
jgi:hypothetical protein